MGNPNFIGTPTKQPIGGEEQSLVKESGSESDSDTVHSDSTTIPANTYNTVDDTEIDALATDVMKTKIDTETEAGSSDTEDRSLENVTRGIHNLDVGSLPDSDASSSRIEHPRFPGEIIKISKGPPGFPRYEVQDDVSERPSACLGKRTQPPTINSHEVKGLRTGRTQSEGDGYYPMQDPPNITYPSPPYTHNDLSHPWYSRTLNMPFGSFDQSDALTSGDLEDILKPHFNDTITSIRCWDKTGPVECSDPLSPDSAIESSPDTPQSIQSPQGVPSPASEAEITEDATADLIKFDEICNEYRKKQDEIEADTNWRMTAGRIFYILFHTCHISFHIKLCADFPPGQLHKFYFIEN